TPAPICQPKPPAYTHGRYSDSHASFTCRRSHGGPVPNPPASTVAATSASTAVTARAALAATPSAPAIPAPIAISATSVNPPSVAPATNHAAVRAKRWPRPASASGVSWESMDNPHGDQVDRAAAASATTTPSTMSVMTMEPPSSLGFDPVAAAERGRD